MPVIEIKNLTKDYGRGRGVFDVSLSVEEGETFGFVGTNGAGKTTTIRHLMGFLKAQKGRAAIKGMDCWQDSAAIKKLVGYIPGEIAFTDATTGMEFLKRQGELMGLKSMAYAEDMIQRLQLDPSANLKRMSKGMKQKTAIVAALMADPQILILDEPTTGLDPLMRAEFIELLQAEKSKGKTIFMSSHMFEEVESSCDKVALIKDGKIIAVKSTKEIKYNEDKVYKLEFKSPEDYRRFLAEGFLLLENKKEQNQLVIKINDRDINTLTKSLRGYKLKFMTEIKFTLAHYFKSLY